MNVAKIVASLFSGTQETTLALANLNFDFSLVKIDAPLEFGGVGSALTTRRRDIAESGSTHITARKLGALFETIIPETPRLVEAYGRRASEIANSASIAEVDSSGRGIFAEFLGPDATSIWAAATSGRAAIAVHLLACLLARIWPPAEAVSIWDEIVKVRKVELNSISQEGRFHISHALAGQVQVDRSQLADWDNSARAWLRFADQVRDTEQTKVKLVIDELRLKVNSKSTPYESVMDAWKIALSGMEELLKGVSQASSNAGLMLALSCWHLYPDISFQGNAPVLQRDDLFPRGVIVSINLEGRPSKPVTGIYWSLSLSYMRYYGEPIDSERSYATESSNISFDSFLQVALGSVSSSWGWEGIDSFAVAQLMQLIGKKASSHLPRWLSMLAETGELFLSSKDSSLALNRKLANLGRSRATNLLAEQTGHPLPLFGLTDFSTFLGALKSPIDRVRILRKYALRFFPGVDPLHIIIRYGLTHDYLVHSRTEDMPSRNRSKSSLSTADILGVQVPKGDKQSNTTLGGKSGVIEPQVSRLSSIAHQGQYKSGYTRAKQLLKKQLRTGQDASRRGFSSRGHDLSLESTKKSETPHGQHVAELSQYTVGPEPMLDVPSVQVDTESRNSTAAFGDAATRSFSDISSTGGVAYASAIPITSPDSTTNFYCWTDRRIGIDKFDDLLPGTSIRPKPPQLEAHDNLEYLEFADDFFRSSANNTKSGSQNEDLVILSTDIDNRDGKEKENNTTLGTRYQLFLGDYKTAAIFVEKKTLDEHECDWSAPSIYRLPKIKRSIDISDVKEALEKDALDLKKWLSALDGTFQDSRFFQSLDLLRWASTLYGNLKGASISPDLVSRSMIDSKWAQAYLKSPKVNTLEQAFSCIAYFESGVDLSPSQFTGVMAMSFGDSIYVSVRLLRDPGDTCTPHTARRLSGNVGKAGLILMVPPAKPMTRPSSASTWRFIDRDPYTGQFEDHFSGTTLHLSFSDWSIPIDVGAAGHGRRDIEAQIVESLVSVFDQGKWVADLNILSALSKGSSQPDHEFFFRARCAHERTQMMFQPNSDVGLDNQNEIVVIRNWDEFLEPPDLPAVVLAVGNWEAKLALACIGISRGSRVFVNPDGVCRACLDDVRGFEEGELYKRTIFLV